jgi:8-oxo-dGTP pyrophosphatase MutT (NUDIX family)
VARSGYALGVQRLTHAGAVVVRRDEDRPRFLLVQPSRGRRGWVLPKGHIEPGERPLDAALREVREEAGVAATKGPSLGTVAFDQLGEAVRARYYLLEFGARVPRRERRRVSWCTYPEALRRLPFPSAKTVIERAWSVVARRTRPRAAAARRRATR